MMMRFASLMPFASARARMVVWFRAAMSPRGLPSRTVWRSSCAEARSRAARTSSTPPGGVAPDRCRAGKTRIDPPGAPPAGQEQHT